MEKIKKTTSLICCFMLLIAFLCPSSAFAEMNAQNELHNNVNRILKYIVVDEDGRITFDENAAELNNESPEIIQMGIDTEAFAEAYYLYEHQNPNSRVEGLPPIPFYGNWCGASYGSGEPIDTLDALCKWHDECYGRYGDFACYCDQWIVDQIDAKYASMGLLERQAATTIAAFFATVMDITGCT